VFKVLGAVTVVAYGVVLWTGYEPFTREERGNAPADARGSARSYYLWRTGFQGGK
jgi:hypothetical protein